MALTTAKGQGGYLGSLALMNKQPPGQIKQKPLLQTLLTLECSTLRMCSLGMSLPSVLKGLSTLVSYTWQLHTAKEFKHRNTKKTPSTSPKPVLHYGKMC